MNLGTQIKKYRMALSLSQEQLAQKVFVSRQSISNWENDKTYPDIKSLILLSELFGISLDQLIKGDLEMMKNEITEQQRAQFQKDSTILAVLMAMMMILPVPLYAAFGRWGCVSYLMLASAGLYYGVRVDRHKKKFNIQTYKEILAFTEGKTLSEIETAREDGKRPYQKVLLALGAALLAGVISACMGLVYRFLA